MTEPEIDKSHASDQQQAVCLRNSVINESDTVFFWYFNSGIINLMIFLWVKRIYIEMLIPELYTGKSFVIVFYYKYDILWIFTFLRKHQMIDLGHIVQFSWLLHYKAFSSLCCLNCDLANWLIFSAFFFPNSLKTHLNLDLWSKFPQFLYTIVVDIQGWSQL